MPDYDYFSERRDILYELFNISLSDEPKHKGIMIYVNIYVTPFIIALGVTGNVMSFLVFACTHLKRQSSSVYLATLAVVDTVFLLSIIIVWLAWLDIPLFHTNGFCQSVVYLNQVCQFMSVWTVVGFTADRYIIVYHPLRKDRLCTTRVAKIVVCVMAVVGLTMNSYSTWTSRVEVFHVIGKQCAPIGAHYELVTVMKFVEVFITLLVPSVTIIVLNIRIVIKIHQFQRSIPSSSENTAMTVLVPPGQHHLTPGCPQRVSVHATVSHRGTMLYQFGKPLEFYSYSLNTCPQRDSMTVRAPTVRGRSQFRLARMLLIVSSIFLVLNIPSHFYQIKSFLDEQLSEHYNRQSMPNKDVITWQALFQIAYYLNFAINFFLYSLCGRPFRNELKRLCSRMSHKQTRMRARFYMAQDEVYHVKNARKSPDQLQIPKITHPS